MAITTSWYERHREECIAKAIAYRKAHPIEAKKWHKAANGRPGRVAAQKKYREANKDKMRAYHRGLYEANGGDIRARNKAFYESNREDALARCRNRRAHKAAAEGSHTAADLSSIRKAQNGRCAMCSELLGRKGHVDHIKALANGGSNWPRNLQWLCAPCNLSKGAKDEIEFSRELGFLL